MMNTPVTLVSDSSKVAAGMIGCSLSIAMTPSELTEHCKTARCTYVHISRNYTSVTNMCTDVHRNVTN
eukprot:836847-Rhodomonas_salina.1